MSETPLERQLRELAARFQLSPEALLALAEAAAKHQSSSVTPNFGPAPHVSAEFTLDDSHLAEWPAWSAPLVEPGCRLERLRWPNGAEMLRLLSRRGQVLAALSLPTS